MISSMLSQQEMWPGIRPWTGRVRFFNDLEAIPNVPSEEREQLKEVIERYAFRANDYYLTLIDWRDPNDPIRRLVIPCKDELNPWGELDASREQHVTVAHGVQHKYVNTVLLLCSQVCGGYCRYCFRKRLFMNGNNEVATGVLDGIRYVAAHPIVNDVILSGGDPLLLSTRRLGEIIGRLRAIPHVNIIRIGSKMPAFNPWRILDDPPLQEVFRKYSTADRRIYLMAHFDHPRELTEPAIRCIGCCLRNGLICTNQCPLIKGVNDDPLVLAELFKILAYIGCPPYYLFQARPTAGNEPYVVPIVRGWQIFSEALRHGPGLARRARFVMSHETGKIEITGVDDNYIYMRYHRAKKRESIGRFMVYHRDDDACWLDQLEPVDGAPSPAYK